MSTKKSLGQHWLKDRSTLEAIVDCAKLTSSDTVLEIGPGLGTMTSVLLGRAERVVAVEYDDDLADKLPGQFPGKNLGVLSEDILNFNLDTLPADYKVVANVPYYITSKIIKKLMTADNQPILVVLLVQKEVAERIIAGPGEMSLLALSAQVHARASLGPIVSRDLFFPPPKVDSQVIVLSRLDEPLVGASIEKDFFRVAKAGFSSKRKKLRSSLSAGLRLDKTIVEKLLLELGISPDSRAQDLSIEQWLTISVEYAKMKG